MCQQGGEFLGEVIDQGGDLFDFLKTCCAQGFESASFWESCTCERERLCMGSVCFVLAPDISSLSLRFLHDCVELYLCL